MNKQEAIKKVEQMGEYERFANESIPKLSVLNILNQLDEPQKVMIPRFIADWIVQAKEDGYNIAGAINEAPRGAVDDWLELENVDIFAEAWINGYTVEKEKRYRVKMKKVGNMSFLNHDLQSDSWLINNGDNGEIFKTHHTRKELEDAGFGWVFDCEGIEIEEVEE